MATPAPHYEVDEWCGYASCHAQITSFVQHEVYLAAAALLYGRVLDLGCGTAKLASYLVDQERVDSYTGIDLAEEMLAMAEHTLGLLQRPDFRVMQADLESIASTPVDSAVSIMSYYAWANPQATLANIAGLIKPGGRLVLATANPSLDIRALLRHARRELIGHREWSVFEAYNLSLADNGTANFVSMDKLVKECQDAGFVLESCHQKFYLGGINFLSLARAQR